MRQIEVRAFAKLQRAIKALEAEQAANSVAALQAPQESVGSRTPEGYLRRR